MSSRTRVPTHELESIADSIHVIVDNTTPPPSIIYNGQVTIAAPRVALAATTAIQSVTIENVSTNDVVYVGNDTVTNANGYALRAGATVSMDIDDLAKVFVTGTVGNVVTYIAVA